MPHVLTLWIRRHHVMDCVLGASLATLCARGLIIFSHEQNGSSTPLAPFWLSVVLTVPLLYLFVHDETLEEVSPRPQWKSHLALLGIALVCILVLPTVAFHLGTPDTGFGALACIRNALGLTGLGLIGRIAASRWTIWTMPVFAALASLSFSWPLYPSLTQSLWGALRAPSPTSLPGGAPNLSWLVCTVVMLAGGALYLLNYSPTSASRPKTYSAGASDSSKDISFTRSYLQASWAWPMGIVLTVLMAWSVFFDTSSWIGSVLLGTFRGVGPISIAMVVSTLVGVVVAQTRWRSGLSELEALSTRPNVQLLTRPLLVTFGCLLLPWLTVFLVTITISATSADTPSSITRALLMLATPALIGVAVTMFLGGLGVALGWIIRRIWIAPASLVLTFMLVLFVFPLGAVMPGDVEFERRWVGTQGLSHCTTSPIYSVEICSSDIDASYLDAVSASIDTIYRTSPYAQLMPRKISVVNNVFTSRVITPGTVAIGLIDQRRFRPGHQLPDLQKIRTDLAQSSTQLCDECSPDALRSAFSSSVKPGDPQITQSLEMLQAKMRT